MTDSLQLKFTSIEFYGIDKMEPKFDPNIKEYTIHRQPGSNFQFKASMNKTPAAMEDNGWNYQAFPGYRLDFHESNSMYLGQWSADQWNGLNSGPGK